MGGWIIKCAVIVCMQGSCQKLSTVWETWNEYKWATVQLLQKGLSTNHRVVGLIPSSAWPHVKESQKNWRHWSPKQQHLELQLTSTSPISPWKYFKIKIYKYKSVFVFQKQNEIPCEFMSFWCDMSYTSPLTQTFQCLHVMVANF